MEITIKRKGQNGTVTTCIQVNRAQAEAIYEIYIRGGAVMASEWTSGRGRYTTKRAVPPFCEEVYTISTNKHLKGQAKKTYENLRKQHPKMKYAIVIRNMRQAKRVLRHYELID